jgi:hypothetical protein
MLLLENTTFVDGMDVSIMKNGIVNVEHSANFACSWKTSLVWALLWIVCCTVREATSMVDSWCCILGVLVLFAAVAVH